MSTVAMQQVGQPFLTKGLRGIVGKGWETHREVAEEKARTRSEKDLDDMR